MPVLKGRALADDPWTFVPDDAPLPAGRDVIVTLERFRRTPDELRAHDGQVGVRAPGGTNPAELDPSLPLIALELAKFTDGRAYSTARLLRERYRFVGELRAVGGVLRDQLGYLARCGFDAFELADGQDPQAAVGAFDDLTVQYQPAADVAEPLWRRHARPVADR